MSDNKKIVCTICGEENSSDSNFCKSCGAPLKEEKSSGKKSAKDKGKAKGESGRGDNKESNEEKTLNPLTALYVVIGLVVAGFIILYASGVFDEPAAVSGGDQSQQMQDFHNGVDLSKLNEINVLKKTVENNPNDYESLIHLAHLLNDSGFYTEAINRYKTYLDNKPKDADVWVDMGVCYFELKKYDDAINSMKTALDISPNHQIANYNIGIVNLARNNIPEAKEWWKKAVEINPTSNIGQQAQQRLNEYK